jgi:hypothetical protein
MHEGGTSRLPHAAGGIPHSIRNIPGLCRAYRPQGHGFGLEEAFEQGWLTGLWKMGVIAQA